MYRVALEVCGVCVAKKSVIEQNTDNKETNHSAAFFAFFLAKRTESVNEERGALVYVTALEELESRKLTALAANLLLAVPARKKKRGRSSVLLFFPVQSLF